MRSSRRSGVAWVCMGFLLIAGFLLLGEHRIHALGLLPYLLLLACPLLHYFSHGGRGHSGHREPEGRNQAHRHYQATQGWEDVR